MDKQKEVDWDAFLREAAKDILVGIVANAFTKNDYTYDDMAKMAIRQASALVRQLKDIEQHD